MNQHTPGPWEAGATTPDWWEVVTPSTVVVRLDRRSDGCKEFREATEADARLIALAPEMADLLGEVARVDHGHTMSTPRETCIRCRCGALLARLNGDAG